jgi:hypothetical protein
VGDQEYVKTAQVSNGVRRRSPVRLEPTLLNELLYPAEDALPEQSPVASIAVDYPEQSVSVFGWRLPWLAVFLVASIAFAFALRRRLGVTL